MPERLRLLLLPLLAAALAACQSAGGVAPAAGPVPATLSTTADPSVKGRVLTWGGSVIRVKNLEDRTLVEIMSYPLDSNGRPLTSQPSQGRFIADYKGFLEPAEYPVGRLVTVTGPMLGYLDGKVGKADYRYPALQADQIRVWQNPSTGNWQRPAVSVGVGVGGGSRGGWSNIGIGIGF